MKNFFNLKNVLLTLVTFGFYLIYYSFKNKLKLKWLISALVPFIMIAEGVLFNLFNYYILMDENDRLNWQISLEQQHKQDSLNAIEAEKSRILIEEQNRIHNYIKDNKFELKSKCTDYMEQNVKFPETIDIIEYGESTSGTSIQSYFTVIFTCKNAFGVPSKHTCNIIITKKDSLIEEGLPFIL